MDQYLIIHLYQPGGQAAWIPADAAGRPLGLAQHGTLEQAAAMAAGRKVCVVVPSESMLLTRVPLPKRRRTKQWLQAVPFALEERLAEDVESLHIAVGADENDDGVPVAAVSHARMSDWRQALHDAGIEAHALVPDCLALPWKQGQVVVAVDGPRVICRDGVCDGFSCERGLFAAMFEARQRGYGEAPPVPVTLYTGSPPDPDGLPAATRMMRLEAGLLAAMAPSAVKPPLDLMQAGYAPRRPGLKLGRWRLAAGLAAAWIVLAAGSWLYELGAMDREYRQLRVAIENEFRTALPNEPMTANPRAQIERRVHGDMGGDGEWLRMLDALSAAVPGVSGVELQSVNWRPGSMEIAVSAARAEQLDDLRGRIAANGHDAAIESASSRGDRVDGRIRIRSGG